jgi:ABC-2 type transport system permease protein
MFQLFALMKKEFLAVWSDKKSRMIIIIPPLVQLVIFSFAVTMEVKNVSIGILDRDNTPQSRAVVRALEFSPTFSHIYRLQSQKELTAYIDSQKIIAAVSIPQEFAKKILAHTGTSLQIIADGRRSNTAQIVQEYVQMALLRTFPNPDADVFVNRIWYNPNLINFWWIVPSLMGTLSMIIAVLLTALSIARERELGTFDQILVSPLSTMTLIVGKTLPPLLISVVEASVIFLVAITLFKVPFVGSVAILYLGLISFLFSIVGLGLLISSISSTQQQGVLGAFVLVVPYILMSGFATPVANMPSWLIPVTDLVSLKYFLILLKGVFLKDISLRVAIGLIIPMLLLGFTSLAFASWFFRKKVA